MSADWGAKNMKNRIAKMHNKQNIAFVLLFPFSFNMVKIPKTIGAKISPSIIHKHSPNGTKL